MSNTSSFDSITNPFGLNSSVGTVPNTNLIGQGTSTGTEANTALSGQYTIGTVPDTGPFGQSLTGSAPNSGLPNQGPADTAPHDSSFGLQSADAIPNDTQLSRTLPRRDPWATDRGVYARPAGIETETERRWYGGQAGDMGPGQPVTNRSLPPLLPLTLPLPMHGLNGMLARTRILGPRLEALAVGLDPDERQSEEVPAPTRTPWEELQSQHQAEHASRNEREREEHGLRQDEEARQHYESVEEY